MGFSHERQAAARVVLRARATGDSQAIDDAETAVSGYLDDEWLDDYIAEHYPNGLPAGDAASSSPAPDLSAVGRVAVIGPQGLEYERYDLYPDGVQMMIQDEGRTLKVRPR